MDPARRTISVDLPNGVTEVSSAWLRNQCACASCLHPSGQRLLDPATISPDLQVGRYEQRDRSLHVWWTPDDHESVYVIESLLASSASPAVDTWDRSTFAAPPTSTHEAVVAHADALLAWLRDVDGRGFGLLHDVPTRDGEVTRVAELFGFVRETNYGRYFDVRSVVDPTNLANTSLALAAHTDNPYRDPVPTLQLLHCLASSASGGDNIVVDGFRIADEVRRQEPDGFELLANRSVTFSYRDETTELSATAPLIELDSVGNARGVRFNARSMQSPSLPTAEMVAWFDAYLLFARLLADPAYQVQFRLEPGDLFIVDNRRVLHGRSAYEAAAGSRHLQGCYADIDGLRSTIAVLERAV
jgi:gamma-butyrobetaine dioxygenase